jgi:hypothetical protein
LTLIGSTDFTLASGELTMLAIFAALKMAAFAAARAVVNSPTDFFQVVSKAT